MPEIDTAEKNLPGTYVRFSKHEYGSENDTLVITLQNEEAHQYLIVRKWMYVRILDGKTLEPEFKVVRTSAVLNEDLKLLKEEETGESYSFDTRENAIFSGTIKYNKLK